MTDRPISTRETDRLYREGDNGQTVKGLIARIHAERAMGDAYRPHYATDDRVCDRCGARWFAWAATPCLPLERLTASPSGRPAPENAP